MSLSTVAVLVCAAVLFGFKRAGELRYGQVGCALLGGYFVAVSRIGPNLGHLIVAVYWGVGSWHL